MIRVTASAAFFLFVVGLAFAGGHESANKGADLATAETCIQCHEKSGLSLKASGADSIAEKIKAIAAGQSSHPQVMQGASDADIAEVARILNEKG
jgi:cytochrome c553